MFSGSGVIYSVSGDNTEVYILTNAHVIRDNVTIGGVMWAKYYEVMYHNNVRVSATLIARDLNEDIAILKAKIEPNNDFTVAKLGDERDLKVGEDVYTIGSPFSSAHNNTLTKGIVSGLNVNVVGDNDGNGVDTNFYLTQIDAALSSGNSGGPLFNMKGEVVGINTMKLAGDSNKLLESMNFSLQISFVKAVMYEHLKYGTYSRPYIGILAVGISDIGLVERETLQISPEILNGIFVEGVFADTPAANVIPKNTVITKINGVAITSSASFSVELLKHKKGDVIVLTIVDLNNENETTKEIILD
jgi:serine protease Do